MATISDLRSVHATLSTTVADVVQITQFWDTIEIANLDESNDLYVTFDGSTPVAGTEGQYVVPAGSAKVFGPPGISNPAGVPGSTTAATVCHRVGVVGSGGSYSVEGHAGV
jgi:hypothetical protein